MVVNEYGVEIDFEVAENYMDDELCEVLHNELAPCADQEFFDAYCIAHKQKFGEVFEAAKANPVW